MDGTEGSAGGEESGCNTRMGTPIVLYSICVCTYEEVALAALVSFNLPWWREGLGEALFLWDTRLCGRVRHSDSLFAAE